MKSPSRKILWLIIAAAIIVGGGLLLADYAPASTPTPRTLGVSGSTASSTTEISVNPGDWQKVLLGTDASSSGSLADNAAGSGDNQPLTETDQLSRALFTQYVTLEQEGQNMQDPTAINTAVTNALGSGGVFAAPTVYTLANLSVTDDQSQAAFIAYGDSVQKLFASYDSNQGEEIQIAETSIDTDDPTVLKQIDPIIAEYEAVVSSLIAIKVPSAMASAHLDLLNTMSVILSSAQLLRHANSDSVGVIQAIEQDQNALQTLTDSFNEIGYVLRANHVVFPTNDPGATLENYIPPVVQTDTSATSATN